MTMKKSILYEKKRKNHEENCKVNTKKDSEKDNVYLYFFASNKNTIYQFY